jgi:hypothetical protein
VIGRHRLSPLLLAVVAGVVLSGCAGAAHTPTTVGMIDVPPGCPGLYERLASIAEERAVVPGCGVEAARDRTAIDAWAQSESLDAREISRFANAFHRGFDRATTGRMPTTGVTVEVRTDGTGVRVDLGALDRLLVAMLHADYDDARIQALMDCYRERTVDDRELDGSRLRLYVPDDPTLCFRGLVLAGRDSGRCDATGIAVPEIALPQRSGVDLRWPATIAIAPGQSPEATYPAELRAALFLVHEFMHFLDNEMGAPPRLSNLAAYERRAYYVQETFGRLVYDGAIDLPTPLIWDDRG